MANAFGESAARNQGRKMRKAISVDMPISMPWEGSGEEISNPVLTNVRQFRPVKREGSQYDYDLQQLDSSLVLRFPLYDIRNNSLTNLKTLLSHRSTEGEQVITLTRTEDGERGLVDEYHGGEIQNGAQTSTQNGTQASARNETQASTRNQDSVLIHAEESQDLEMASADDRLDPHPQPLDPHPQPVSGQEYLDEFSVSHSPYSHHMTRFRPQSEKNSIGGRNFEEAIQLYDNSEEDTCVISGVITASPDNKRSISVPCGGVSEAHTLTEEQAILELYNPHSVQTLEEAIEQYPALVNCSSMNNEAPIHTIVKMKRKDKLSLLVTLLTNSNADVNIETRSSGFSPLHQAVLEEDEMCVKTLLCFGANIKSTEKFSHTPLQVCSNQKLINLLEAVEAAYIEPGVSDESYEESRRKETLMEYIRRRGELVVCDELEEATNRILSLSCSLAIADTTDVAAVAFQKREVARFRMTNPHIPRVLSEGDRILCLDGGGMKGLAQIEVLCQLEVATGRKITQLFDWIVGTSTGAIIALAMVYMRMTLPELRRLYFQLKEKVFGNKGPNNSQALQDILISTFGTTKVMSDVRTPKILIGAVNKSTTNLEFKFFNNCFDDEFSHQLVWKVARYTSAAPLYFTEFDNYVDGGVLANNPCEYALTAIQNFYREQKMRPQVSLLVSVGSGVYPALKLGNIDAQQFLYFGIHTFRLDILRDRATNLISLLSNALVESEAVAKNCKSRCEEQGILFYRFSPKLDEVIAGGETDTEKLVNMLIQTKLQAKDQGLGELVQLLRDFWRNHF